MVGRDRRQRRFLLGGVGVEEDFVHLRGVHVAAEQEVDGGRGGPEIAEQVADGQQLHAAGPEVDQAGAEPADVAELFAGCDDRSICSLPQPQPAAQ